MQEHHVDVAERIQFSPAITAQGDERKGRFGFSCLISRGCGGGSKYALQQHIDQIDASGTNFASARSGLMSQSQAMLLDLEKLFVERQSLGWTPRSRRSQLILGVRQ